MGTPERKRRQYRTGSVSQRSDGMWIGRIEAGTDRNGKRRRIVVSATTEARCKEKVEAKKQEIARTGIPEKLSGRAMTVEAWANQWLQIVVNDLAPNAYKTTASTVKVWIVPTIGRKRLNSVGPADVRAVLDAQRIAGRALGTRRRTHSDLMQMFTAAILDGYEVPQNVLLAKRPKRGENDREAMPVESAIAILQWAADDSAEASMWAAALINGVRQGERLGLEWDRIDFVENEIDISWQLQSLPYNVPRDRTSGFRKPDGYIARHLVDSFHLVRPKTRKGQRTIPMVPELRAALLAHRDQSEPNEHGLVWVNDRGRPIQKPDDAAAWRRAQEAAGIDPHPAGRRYEGHETRHTTITLLKALGIEDDVIETIVGQSKLVKDYDHSDKLPKARKALEQVSKALMA